MSSEHRLFVRERVMAVMLENRGQYLSVRRVCQLVAEQSAFPADRVGKTAIADVLQNMHENHLLERVGNPTHYRLD